MISTIMSHPYAGGQISLLSRLLRRLAIYVPAGSRCRVTKRSTQDDQKSKVLVRFVKGSHSDPYPFDGKGGTFGHVFYPDSSKGERNVFFFLWVVYLSNKGLVAWGEGGSLWMMWHGFQRRGDHSPLTQY